ncbi:hypothetical protein PpBr36_03375 [Pyricularia pennisetigena]|uniref:hypothetical protein n=1 Tax=Pyricularia pennisetigena TaxID=1578925 RepID=UPI00114FCE04|nr:hypothetical protein PpBr36_03375 [Pyricularia pennisetigena]TLS29884.1 hypothetical protein PpBr36_03375 [Pyricularia pennisetigena]
MASEESVQPLRLSRNSVASQPAVASSIPRALTEISPTEKRRNSPSWNQTTKKMTLSTDSSPFQSSPLDGATSPRLFWKNRNLNSENNSLYGGRAGSPSPTRRSSIERLQKASRVKNSNILALEQKQEYDPTRIPQVERPLAKVQGNAYGGTGAAGLRSPEAKTMGHQRTGSKSSIPLYSPTKAPAPTTTGTSITTSPPVFNPPQTPGKESTSPMKSSLSTSRFKSSYDQDSAAESSQDERQLANGRYLGRHAKSVTFDAAPPQVNEYEMATPDLSSIGSNSREGSFESEEDDEDYGEHYGVHEPGAHDDSFDASLEDTDKTPVVGPEDWRQDSPAVARNSQLEDPFDGSPMPETVPTMASNGRPQTSRGNSASSNNGDHRPLPPLPGVAQAAGAQRNLPSPPPASASSKPEQQNIGNGRMPLEERLRLMMLSDGGKTAAEQQRERRMRRAGARDRVGSPTPEREAPSASINASANADVDASFQDEEDDQVGDISALEEYQLPPRISRESILRRVNGNKSLERDSDYQFSSPIPSSSPERASPGRSLYSPDRPLPLDPDVPIPSTEDSYMDDSESSVVIHRDEDDDDQTDDSLYDMPDVYDPTHSNFGDRDTTEDRSDDDEEDEETRDDIDSESHYSDLPVRNTQPAAAEEDITATPRATSPVEAPAPEESKEESPEPPKVPEKPRTIDFGSDLQGYMLPRPDKLDTTKIPQLESPSQNRPSTPDRPVLSKPEYDGSGWGDDDDFSEPGTPESVIHHPMPDDDYDPEDESPRTPQSPRASPAIPEEFATIKASGSKLKTRPSATPSDLVAMREARRQVSREIPDVPVIPDRHKSGLGTEMSMSESEAFLERHPSFKERSLTLDLDLGLSLDQDFDRVIESQKRGYLMRQNTKVVTASDKDRDEYRFARSAGNSPVKQDRPQSWTVEPWNPQVRKKSVRKRPTPSSGPAPPLPGQESNVAGLSSLAEDELAVDLTPEDNGERGRLFVKVMGVKDLDLPLPRNERTWFSLTLDNGVHCVTTAWLELARNAPIGQEFELVVPNDLEFQLTLNVKLEKPAPQKVIQSPTKLSRPKTSTFSRVFASPKKRKEMEMRMREEEERLAREQQEANARLRSRQQPTAWDLLSPLAADDGSFARSYISLKEHESKCFGRPYVVDVACFNEWAVEEAGFASSVKSKRGNTGQVVRRAPYKIGKLELQLLFVPRPRGCSDDDMPKSMNSCIREMRAAEERLSRNWEGPLSQQGGDCPYWRRRYFKLVGTKLTAYHEATRQPRATINLANAKRLIDDRRALMEKETTGKGGKRRRSAFAEDEEGYMFVEEGFRIRFNNGEIIDFYADTAQDKEGWMKVLSEVIGRDSISGDDDNASLRTKNRWCELVLKREETIKKRAEGRRVHSRTKSMHL